MDWGTYEQNDCHLLISFSDNIFPSNKIVPEVGLNKHRI